MTEETRNELIRLLTSGNNIPDEYKEILFPTINKEYELSYFGKMKKEDILKDADGTFAVPLQKNKTFIGDSFDDDWENMLIFGDNLQLLKTIYANEDLAIKNKIKGKVKLIYIDPPFATESEFASKKGAKAYSDKVKGADFIEFLRRRLIIAREILSEDGSIFVHLDWKMSHYIKIVLDEVFGKNNFRNEIIWTYTGPGSPGMKQFNRKHDVILWYSKTDNWIFNSDDIRIKSTVHVGGFNNEMDKNGSEKYSSIGKIPEDWWNIAVAARRKIDNIERTGYPTEKPIQLVERIIKAVTKPGDIVFDFFAGSGTTGFVAEKLGRKWIMCDIGKLSYYTIQQRFLNIINSKSLIKSNEKYNKKNKTFSTYQLGLYDLEKTLKLDWENYKKFVSELFEFELKELKISGINFDGIKRNHYVKIWDFNRNKDSSVDENYLKELHKNIGSKVNGRIYIVAPSNNVDFLNDYFEICGIRYYFLKIPYQVIKELHKYPFQKMEQSRNINSINNIDMSIGFHFIEQPDVESRIELTNKNIRIVLNKFYSKTLADKDGNEYKNFETLAAIFVDKNYDGKNFLMTDYYFADDLKIIDDAITIDIERTNNSNVMIVYTDIFGNEFVEVKKR